MWKCMFMLMISSKVTNSQVHNTASWQTQFGVNGHIGVTWVKKVIFTLFAVALHTYTVMMIMPTPPETPHNERLMNIGWRHQHKHTLPHQNLEGQNWHHANAAPPPLVTLAGDIVALSGTCHCCILSGIIFMCMQRKQLSLDLTTNCTYILFTSWKWFIVCIPLTTQQLP